ncbi:phosphoribosylglycinamide formyltransferase [Desulfobacterota bacterium M19]
MKLAVLLSGTGRTLDNFHAQIEQGSMRGSIEVVIANTPEAPGLRKAEKYGYPAICAPDNEAVNRTLNDYDVDMVLLAGYLKLYSPPPELARAVLNIHPSLIPSFCGPGFYGMRVHRAVYERGVKVSGCTVHFANQYYDEGPIVVQKCVPLKAEDSPDDIAARVFAAECAAYPEAVNLVCARGIDYFWQLRQGGGK